MQVQRFLGHHKPSFTLDVYVHFLDEDLPEPPSMGNEWATQEAETSRNEEAVAETESRMVTAETLAVARAV